MCLLHNGEKALTVLKQKGNDGFDEAAKILKDGQAKYDAHEA